MVYKVCHHHNEHTVCGVPQTTKGAETKVGVIVLSFALAKMANSHLWLSRSFWRQSYVRVPALASRRGRCKGIAQRVPESVSER